MSAIAWAGAVVLACALGVLLGWNWGWESARRTVRGRLLRAQILDLALRNEVAFRALALGSEDERAAYLSTLLAEHRSLAEHRDLIDSPEVCVHGFAVDERWPCAQCKAHGAREAGSDGA